MANQPMKNAAPMTMTNQSVPGSGTSSVECFAIKAFLKKSANVIS
jgi:hypothetical protein